jgi:hypothetical protein
MVLSGGERRSVGQTITINAEHKRSLLTPAANHSCLLSYTLFGYHSIDKKYLWVCVKFHGGLSIMFARKLRSKKSRTFAKGLFPNGGNWNILKFELFKTDRFWTPIFFKELLISQSRDGQPTVKFYRHYDKVHIYRLIPRNKHFCVVYHRER